jgi:hypothetical protein
VSPGLGIFLTGLVPALVLVVVGRRRFVRYFTKHGSGPPFSSPFASGPNQVPRTYSLIFSITLIMAATFLIVGAVKLLTE